MKAWVRVLIGAAFPLAMIMPAGAGPAEAPASESVVISKASVLQKPHRHFQAEVESEVKASRSSAWSTLTDFDHQASFIPNIASSHLIQTPEGTRVEQVGVIRFLGFRFHRRALFIVKEEPAAGTIDLHAIEGDFWTFDQHWTVEGDSRAVHLSYKADVVPKGHLPQWIVNGLIRRSVYASVKALAAEMLKRQPEKRPN